MVPDPFTARGCTDDFGLAIRYYGAEAGSPPPGISVPGHRCLRGVVSRGGERLVPETNTQKPSITTTIRLSPEPGQLASEWRFHVYAYGLSGRTGLCWICSD